MTREDGSHEVATTGKRRSGKGKRTKGVGRTGARFPSIREEEPDDTDETPDTGTATQPEAAQASPPAPTPSPPASTSSSLPAHPSPSHASHASPAHGSPPHASHARAPSAHAAPAPGSAAPASAHVSASASAQDSAAAGVPSGDVASHDEDGAEYVGRTGARFGPYSVRKPKRAKEFDTGSTPVVDSAVETPPGEPTPEQSAERTMPLIKPWAGALVRPYAHTGGRTRSSHTLELEALVSSSWRPGVGDAVLTTHHRRMIVDLCAQPRSVAEVAALLSVPLGVARVLLGDLATAGVVVVHATAGTNGDGEPDLAFMQRVLVGLRRL